LPQSTDTPFLEELPWSRAEDVDGSFYFIGYLEFCSHGNNTYFYRASTGMREDPSAPCSIDTSTTSPLIRMLPRTNYKLILINRSNEPTNLHTHGLHVAGVGTVDDITRQVDPGNCLVYWYRIRDDADVGTFWYHSHRHPIAAKQVAGGAYGMLIVDEPHIKTYPKHLRRFFENEILLQYASILDKTTNIRTNLLNGKSDPLTIPIGYSEYYYFRVSFVVISDPISYLEFYPKNACEVRVMAYDGVYRSSLPHPESVYKHMMTTSSRVDLAVQCKQDATIYFHQGKRSDDTDMVKIQVYNSQSEADVIPSSPYWDAKTQKTWNPRRPYYMPNLMNVNTNFWRIASWNVTMDSVLLPSTTEISANNSATHARIESPIQQNSINHIRWDPDIAIRKFQLGQLVELNLFNTGQHPFHIHINRMQIVQPGGCGYRYEEGEYYDTITSDDRLSTSCTVRMQFWDFAGRIIAHCHKLKHEDKGMMVWIDVLGGPEHGMNGTEQVACSSLV
jgi:FtsP/CotA-like multicopper oxidase with cupredoxin domain